MEPIRILIADDHANFRSGLRAMLRREPSIEIISEAANGAEAVTQAEALQPDVILMDLHMPEINGIEATRRILRDSPHMRVLVLTMFEDDESVVAAMQMGARGYVLKGSDKAGIVRAIRAVASGEAIFGPAIAQRMIQLFKPRTASRADAFPDLTERELEILTFIADGWSNTQIADHLVVSLKTVRNHVSNIFNKLEVADRTEAIQRARQAGLGSGTQST